MIQLSFNILQETALLLIIASSFALLYFATKFINIAHGVTITLGAYSLLFLTHTLRIPLFAAMPLAIGMAALFGVFCELLLYRKLRNKEVSPLSQLIASIGVYIIFQNCLSITFGDQSSRIDEGGIEVGHFLLGGYISTIAVITLFVSGLTFLGLLLFTTRSGLGLKIRAVSDNPELSAIYGIDSDTVILWTYAVSSAIGALGGILFSFDTSLYPTMGFKLLLFGLAAMIIGGVGNYKSLIGGSLLLVVARQCSAYYVDAKWMDTAAYSILLLFLVWRPYGLSGNRLRKVEI